MGVHYLAQQPAPDTSEAQHRLHSLWICSGRQQVKNNQNGEGILTIVVDVEDGLEFACIDFSLRQQKRRKVLCIQTDLFFNFPITQPSFPINPLVWLGHICKKAWHNHKSICSTHTVSLWFRIERQRNFLLSFTHRPLVRGMVWHLSKSSKTSTLESPPLMVLSTTFLTTMRCSLYTGWLI